MKKDGLNHLRRSNNRRFRRHTSRCDEAGEDAYAQLIIKLNKHFLPKKNKDFARFQFGNLKQNHGESLVRYYTRIREIAKKCSFSNESEAIRDHLIKTMTNNVVCIKAIRKNWTLNQILEEAELDEETRTQAKEMEKKVNSDETIKRVQNYHVTSYMNMGHCLNSILIIYRL
jgi:Arc/MetJ-type ribon-helix-helix transcriptional regulator